MKLTGLRMATTTCMVLLALMVTRRAGAQNFEVLYSFTGTPDGGQPFGTLIADPDGNLYGVTTWGGIADQGTVYELPATGGETVLYSFTGGSDGRAPAGSLLRDASGNLYGTTASGGDLNACSGYDGCGVVFELSPLGKEKVLYAFMGASDGWGPSSGLIRDAEGNLYGTTSNGGDLACNSGHGCGVVFKVDLAGKETVLHTFTGPPDGALPLAGVVLDADGDLYGTTYIGGDGSACGGEGCGVVFEIDAQGNETLLHSFTGGTDGGFPAYGALIRDSGGNLYGTTSWGGDLSCPGGSGCGVVFRLDPAGNETVLQAFDLGDGGYPLAGVIRDASGNLYGTTSAGGSSRGTCAGGCGMVFELDAAGNETVLHAFDETDGYSPYAGLLPYKGYLYGTTPVGGINGTCESSEGCGVAFKIKP
jgi:uncharacterized repeat protein (TIGR03803 family)